MRDDLALIRELNDPTATVGEARRLAGLDAPRPALARYGSECGPRTGREHQQVWDECLAHACGKLNLRPERLREFLEDAWVTVAVGQNRGDKAVAKAVGDAEKFYKVGKKP